MVDIENTNDTRVARRNHQSQTRAVMSGGNGMNTRSRRKGNQTNGENCRSSSKHSHTSDDLKAMGFLPVDRFGFFVEDGGDDNDENNADLTQMLPGYRSSSIIISDVELRRRNEKEFERERKWIEMIREWPNVSKKVLKRRIKKGIPDSARAFAWVQACGVIGKTKRGKTFAYYVKAADSKEQKAGGILEVIERDICRTFPKHELFAESKSSLQKKHGFHLSTGTNPVDDSVSVMTPNIKPELICNVSDNNHGSIHDKVINAFQCQGVKYTPSDVISIEPNLDATCKNQSHSIDLTIPEAGDNEVIGQKMLRRLLRAYSEYDTSTGYCQGMGFIAAMFLTYLPEEESFWQFVAVMNKEPCCLRDLYGVGMIGSQKVLYIAEKLSLKFLPKLSKHFSKESIHISMFATQWLITIYTSNFSFDLVTRVWDVFLFDGWKIVYRVFLALLEYATPHLLKLNFEEVLFYLKSLPRNIDGEAIMKVAFSIPLRRKHIAFYEKQWNKNEEK